MKLKTLISTIALACSICLSKAQQADIIQVVQLISRECYTEALDSLTLMASRDSLDDAVWYYSGCCLQQLGRDSEAAAAWRKAQALDPGNKDYRSPMILDALGGDALYNLRDYELALSYFQEAFEKDPYAVPSLIGKIEANRLLGRNAAFFSDMRQFLQLEYLSPEPKASFLLKYLNSLDGRTYQLWHTQIDALPDLLVQMHPDDPEVLNTAASWFYATGREEKGLEYFKRWAEKNPDDPSAAFTLIAVYNVNKGPQAALDLCCEYLDKNPGDSLKMELLGTKGDLLILLGKNREGYKAYEQALKLNPDHPTVLNNYAYQLCIEGKRLRKAEKLSRRAIELNPDNPSYLDTYGWILHLLGKDAEAKAICKRCMVYGGKEHVEVLLHYSEVLKALGENDLARYYRQLYESKNK